MKSIAFLAAFAILVALVLAFLKGKRSSSDPGTWPYHARRTMSVPEQVLYFRLRDALPDYMVLAQVSMSRFLGVDKGNDQQAWHNRISRMTVDFVICRKDASVFAVVELDDATHDRKKRKAADEKKDRALAAAGIPIVRWQAKLMPEVKDIRRQLGHTRQTENRAVQQAA